MRLKVRSTALLLSAVLSLSSLLAQTPAGLSNQDLEELAHYTLTMKNITQFIKTLADLQVLTTAHPDLASMLNAIPTYYGLAETDHRLAAHPEIVAILARHGLTPHEFNLLLTTWFSSTDSASAPKSGTSPEELTKTCVNPANIAFREKHKAEIEALVLSTFGH